MISLIQTQPTVKQTEAERIFAQMLPLVTAQYLNSTYRENWESLFRIWQEAWSDDRGIDLTQFPVPAAPLPDVAINEDAVMWQASVNTGINQF